MNVTYDREVTHCEKSPYLQEVTVLNIYPAQNSDFLELLQFKEIGWQIVTKKGEYKKGDRLFFCPPESVIPRELAEEQNITSYLKKGLVRVVRLRKNVSAGLPLSIELGNKWKDFILHWNDPPKLHMSGSIAAREDVPFFFTKFFEMPNLRNVPYTFYDGELIVYSEKLHGCLHSSTKITLADGTRKTIKEIVDKKLDVEVLAMNEQGQLVPSKILNWFNNGHCENWKVVKFKRNKMGKGNYYGTVICTTNHKFFIPLINDYVECEKLNIMDKILVQRTELSLTYIQEQILIGIMIGDGSLSSQKNSIHISHKKEHEEYINYTMNSLGNIAGNFQKNRISGYGTEMIRSRTISNFNVYDLFKDWVNDDNNKKQIPKSIIGKLSPISLAFWYMDDGNLLHNEDQEDRIGLAVCRYNENSVNNLISALKILNIESGKKFYDNYFRITINSDNSDIFFSLIIPYIPKCMQYKLPEKYRGYDPVYFNSKNKIHYKTNLIEQEIISIENFNQKNRTSKKYDIETEHHNYIANYVITHNSNTRFSLMKNPKTNEYELYVGSHNVVLKEDENNLYWEMIKTHLDENHVSLQDVTDLEFFGEIYGPGIQDGYTYGLKEPKFVIFNISKNGRYFHPDQIEDTCKLLKLPCVKYHRDVFDMKKMESIAESPSEYTDKHIREGIVLISSELPDKMAKLVSLKYLESR